MFYHVIVKSLCFDDVFELTLTSYSIHLLNFVVLEFSILCYFTNLLFYLVLEECCIFTQLHLLDILSYLLSTFPPRYKSEFDRNESRWVWVSKCQTFLRCIFFSFWNWIQDFLKKKTKDYRSTKPFLVQVKLLKRGDDNKLRTDRILLAVVWKMKNIPTNFWPLVCLCL